MEAEPRTGLTFADFLDLADERRINELIGGELMVPPPPGFRHQRVVMALAVRLHAYVEEQGGVVLAAPFAVKLSERDVVEPDVFYVRPERSDRFNERHLDGPPDLVVEVSSPSTRQVELDRKRALYERRGVSEYWLIDPDAGRVDAYLLEGERYGLPRVSGPGDTLRPQAMPGLEIPVADVLGADPR